MFTYNGIDFSQLVKVQDVRRPVLAPQRLSTVSIEGRHGSYFYRKVSDSVTIEIDIAVVANSPTELRKKIRDLAEKLDAEEPKPLIIHDEPDKYINVIISDNTDLEGLYYFGKTTVKFFAPDPFWYAVYDDIFEFTTTGVKNFTRKGNADSYPRIEIKGTSNGGSFTVITDNTTMTFTGTLLQGEKLVLDSDLLTAYIIKADGSTVSSAIKDLDNINFPVFVKGANSINVVPNGGATLESYKVYCNSRWK